MCLELRSIRLCGPPGHFSHLKQLISAITRFSGCYLERLCTSIIYASIFEDSEEESWEDSQPLMIQEEWRWNFFHEISEDWSHHVFDLEYLCLDCPQGSEKLVMSHWQNWPSHLDTEIC